MMAIIYLLPNIYIINHTVFPRNLKWIAAHCDSIWWLIALSLSGCHSLSIYLSLSHVFRSVSGSQIFLYPIIVIRDFRVNGWKVFQTTTASKRYDCLNDPSSRQHLHQWIAAVPVTCIETEYTAGTHLILIDRYAKRSVFIDAIGMVIHW